MWEIRPVCHLASLRISFFVLVSVDLFHIRVFYGFMLLVYSLFFILLSLIFLQHQSYNLGATCCPRSSS